MPGRAAFCAVILLGVAFLRLYRIEWDTLSMIEELRGSLRCLSQGVWTGCEAGGQFPLFQKIPSVPLAWLGLTDRWIGRIWVEISLLCYGVVLYWGYIDFKKISLSLSWSWVGVILASPLVWYSRTSFGELFAALLTLGYVRSILKGDPGGKVFAWALLAGLSKETAFPFLFALGFAAQPKPFRWKPVLAGIAAALLLNSLHNLFRFGTFSNQRYLDPLFLVQDAAIQTEFFLGLWFSPAGGLFVYWPAVTVLCLGLPFLLKGTKSRRWLAYLSGLGVLVLLNLGFSSWYAPMGWHAWGPRLTLPWLPAILYLWYFEYGPEIRGAIRRLASHSFGFKAAGAGLVLASVANFAVTFDMPLLSRLFSPDEVFPNHFTIQDHAAGYYEVTLHIMWNRWGAWLEAFKPYPQTRAFLCTWLAAGLLFAGWLRLGRMSLLTDAHGGESASSEAGS